jgi:hypothetical protein
MHHIIFGECFIEDRLTARVMDCWQAGHSSLREHGPIGLHHPAVGHLDAHRPLHQRRPGRPSARRIHRRWRRRQPSGSRPFR